jgi:transposase
MSEFVIASTSRGAAPRCRTATRQAWAERLTRFAASGLSVAQFCALEGVSLPSFYSWKRRLSAGTPGRAAEHTADTASGPRLLPVYLANAGSAVELVLPGGTALRLVPGCDLAFVRALVEALGGAPC